MVMQTYIFALIAIALSDNGNTQTIRYFAEVKDCKLMMEQVEKQINKDFVRLDCVPLKVKDIDYDTTR